MGLGPWARLSLFRWARLARLPALPQLSPASSRPNAETATAPEHVPPMQWHTAYWPGEQAGLQTTNPQTSFGRGCDTTSAETGARLRSVVCLQEGLEMQRSARMPHWMSPQVLRLKLLGHPAHCSKFTPEHLDLLEPIAARKPCCSAMDGALGRRET